MPVPTRPSKADVLAAAGRRVPDVIAHDLDVLFCGINPGLYSAATGHHFARPGNRFWPALYAAGFTKRVLAPWEERLLLRHKLGITNLVAWATASAAELSSAELRRGRVRLERKVARYAPRWVAVVGIGAYRIAFDRRRARPGRQEETLREAGIWVLPNPSGINANHQLNDLARAFRQLREAVQASRPPRNSPGGASYKRMRARARCRAER